jgi:hypothetical protein
MSLTLMTAACGDLCARAALETAFAAARAGLSPTVIAESADAGWAEHDIAETAPVGFQLTSATRFITELWGVYGDGRRLAGALASEIIMRKAITNCETSVFGASLRTPGFARAMVGAARGRAARSGNVDSEALERGVEQISAEYERQLRECGLVSTSEATEALIRARPVLRGPLCVAAPHGVDAELRKLCVALAARNDVSIALTWDRDVHASQANEAAIQELLDSGAAHRHLDAGTTSNGEIAELVRALRRGTQEVAAAGAVRMGVTTGPEAEATMIVSSVTSAIGAGIRRDRIAIVLPHLRLANAIARAMRAEGIGYRLRGAIRLSATPFGRAFRALLAAGRRSSQLAITGNSRGDDAASRTAEVADPCLHGQLLGRVTTLSAEPLDARALCAWSAVADELLANMIGAPDGEWGGDDAMNCAAHQSVLRLLSDAAEAPGATAGDVLDAVGRKSAHLASGSQGVQVCDWKNMDAADLDVVILAGLAERDMPLRRDDAGGLPGRPRESSEPDSDKLRLRAIAGRARDGLFLIRQETDADGTPLRACQFWNEVLDAYRLRTGGEPTTMPPQLRLAGADIEEYAPVLTVERRLDRRAAQRMTFGAAILDRIEESGAKEALQRERAFSASEVESYLRCPQRWFWQWVVRPADADGTLGARELGMRAHGYLAEFYRRVAEGAAAGWSAEDRVWQAAALLEEVVESEHATLLQPRTLSEKLDAARAVRWARAVVEQDITYAAWPVTEHVEAGFGVDEPFEFGGHRFRGRIDRIDRAGEGGLSVIDYKSSRDVPGFSQFERVGVIQAVVYAAATEEVFGRPVLASAYRSMTSGCVRGFWRADLLGGAPRGMREDDGIDEGAALEMRSRAEERVAAAISGMKAGSIGRNPAANGSCDYCPVRVVCEGAR